MSLKLFLGSKEYNPVVFNVTFFHSFPESFAGLLYIRFEYCSSGWMNKVNAKMDSPTSQSWSHKKHLGLREGKIENFSFFKQTNKQNSQKKYLTDFFGFFTSLGMQASQERHCGATKQKTPGCFVD